MLLGKSRQSCPVRYGNFDTAYLPHFVLLTSQSESTHQHTEQFLEAMKLYQASIKDEKASSLDLRGKHCWEDVLRAAKEAEATYLRSGDHLSRKLGRFITANVEVALPFLYLLPNDWYCCVLFGGLKLVFEVGPMNRMSGPEH